ncbi:MAG: tetratricopeptide repeat protein [Planctomycetes bacterium]|nr:tetratricopeptide repeat protein [Planctomycetota bacterium]
MSDKIDIEKMLGSIGNEKVPGEISDLSADIISQFGRAVEVAESGQSHKSRLVSWLGGLCYRFAAGAAFALVIIATYFVMTRTSSIAWADVVSAMGKVDQMRAKVIVEDPRSRDEKIFTIEMFYKSPDKCRAHGRGFVQFINGDVNRIFSVEKNELLKEGTRRPAVIPPGFMSKLHKKGLLNSMLEIIFMGKVPAAEPVISSGVTAGEGIEVFDYSNNVNQMWARIWVLKKSRLPVRMKIFYPSREKTDLVILDYTEHQGDEFFDVDKFMDQAKDFRKGQAHTFYNIGKSVVTANPKKPGKVKPTNPVHIHKIEGISAPVFKSIEQAGNGDLRIVALDPGNRDKNGRPVNGAYRDELRDNWGNIYIRYAGRSRYEKGRPIHFYYARLEPFKKGEGVHKIKLVYTMWDYMNGVGYDKIVGNEEVIIPDIKTDGVPKHWYKNFNGSVSIARNDALKRINCAATMSIAEQWDYLNKLIEKNPDDDSALQSKLQMIRDLEDEEAYFDFFEKHLLEKRLAMKFGYVMHYYVLPGYLTYLYNNGRADEYYKHAKVLNEKKEAFLKDKRTSKRQIERVKNHEWRLSMVLEIPAVVKKAAKLDKPKIVKTAVSADGKVLVEIDFPKDKNGNLNRNIFGGVRNAKTKKGGYLYNSQLYMFDKNGDTLNLEFSVIIEGVLKDKPSGSWPKPTIYMPIEIDLPKASERNAEELKGEFDAWKKIKQGIKDLGEWVKVSGQAYSLEKQERYSEAIEKYGRAVELMKARLEDPSLAEDKRNTIKNNILSKQLGMSKCLMEMGKLQEAIGVIESSMAEARERFGDESLRGFYWYSMIVGRLIEKGKLDEAQKLLDKIGKDKPSLREYDNYRQVKKTQHGYTSSQKRYDVYSKWKPYYIAEWKLREARRGK